MNQTVSVPREPLKEAFLWRNIVEYRNLADRPELIKDFDNAIMRYRAMRDKQREDRNRLKVQEIKT